MKSWFQKHSIAISLIPVIGVMVMIYCFSAQTGDQSGAMSGKVTRWIAELLIQNFESLPEAEQILLCSRLGLVIRKLAHFSEYALLGFFLMLHIRQILKKVIFRLPTLWGWCVGTLYAVSDELHQGFVGGRHPAWTDVLIDSSGVLAGILLCLLLYLLLHRKTAQPGGSNGNSVS